MTYSLTIKANCLLKEDHDSIIELITANRELFGEYTINSNSSGIDAIELPDILSDVSLRTGISIEAIRSRSRLREVVEARHFFFARARELTLNSLICIGKFVGKDHSTVVHGVSNVRNIYQLSEKYCRLFGGDKPEKPMTYVKREERALLIGISPIRHEVSYAKPEGVTVRPYSGYREHSF